MTIVGMMSGIIEVVGVGWGFDVWAADGRDRVEWDGIG